MKVGVLSLFLHSNYGGILQSWALQETLRFLGHSPVILRYEAWQPPLMLLPFVFLHRVYLRVIRKRDVHLLGCVYTELLERNIRPFVNKEINRSPILKDEDSLRDYCKKNNLDAIIVGSDQVWRPEWTSPIFFLSFVDNDDAIIRIAYAVSFGCDSPDFGTLKNFYADEASFFDSISVRESPGVEQCRKMFGLEVEFAIDPTMLIDPRRYLRLSRGCKFTCPGKYVATYFLCEKRKFGGIADTIANMLGLDVLALLAENEYKNDLFPKPMKSVETWICTIEESEYVITDSFHGCVFSILFGKSFIALDNGTGVGRIRSLLGFFGLSNRLVSIDKPKVEILAILKGSLPKKTIQGRLDFAREKSLDFLKRALRQGLD